MITSYIYENQKERYIAAASRQLEKKTHLNEISVENGFVLPVRRKKGHLFGAGGVVNSNYTVVKESEILSRGGTVEYPQTMDDFENYMGEGYEFTEDQASYFDEEVVYLGFIRNHWGHFLLDCSTRLWITQKYGSSKKYVFLVNENDDFKLIDNIKRFLELYDVPLDRIEFVNEIRKYKKIIVPEASYISNCYFSDEYVKMFDSIASKIDLSKFKKYDKVYFTRSSFRKANNSEIGEELLVSLFEKNDFKIISPEKCSLDEQIALIQSASIVSGISGTITHNMLFASDNKKLIIINKTYIINMMQMDVNYMKKIQVSYVDAYATQFPVNLGWGPFVFVFNNHLRDFIQDFGFKSLDSKFESSEYLRKNLVQYQSMYRKRVLSSSKTMNLSSDKHSVHYFDSEFLKIYYEKYYAITYPITFFEKITSIIDKINLKISNMVDKFRGVKR